MAEQTQRRQVLLVDCQDSEAQIRVEMLRLVERALHWEYHIPMADSYVLEGKVVVHYLEECHNRID